jgi:transposase InsO family protein
MRCRKSRWNRRPTATAESPPNCRSAAFDINHKRGVADDARRQSAVRAAPQLCGDHRFAPQPAGYPNLAGQIAPTAINQLWVADITYIRLRPSSPTWRSCSTHFPVASSAGLWGELRGADLAVTALSMALVERGRQPGLVHHSDPGVQYASQAYNELLKQHLVQIGMSRKGNPYDNAACESFMKTLKYEEVYRTEYRISGRLAAGSASFSSASTTGTAPLRPRLCSAGGVRAKREARNEVAACLLALGALPPNPRDLSRCRRSSRIPALPL